MENKIEKLISEMSVAEKALLCSGRRFWFTRGIKKYGIEPYMVSDGPHGLRKQADTADNLGINNSIKATCFPPASTMASSWDKDLIHEMGVRIAKEAKAERVGIVLGPGANIKRSPLCGRNFEYFSEDPYLSSRCAASWIMGVQSLGIGTSLKHFAVNNQEDNRFRCDAVVDERALREIYLNSFEYAVKEAKPYTIMCAYNRINGTFASESRKLLTDVLRGEWGFDGYVMSDWGAVNDKVEGLKNGMELEMPGGSGESVHDIIAAVSEGRLKKEVLDNAVRKLLRINLLCKEAKEDGFTYDKDEHHDFVRKAAAESAVLLKNDEDLLPLDKSKKITVIGSLFKDLRYQGSGSSLINPHKVVSPFDAFTKNGIAFNYAEGYSPILDTPNEALINEAYEVAKQSEGTIVVFAGLTKFYESEGFDRKHMQLPTNQNILIEKLQGLHKKMVIVLFGGAPVEMPWTNGVDVILNMYLPGQAGGESTYDVIFGDVNPSGRLAETYPIKLEDNPSFNYFPEGPITAEYRESIFVGYRYYDTFDKKVLFPFGHGLSYTKFAYSDLELSTFQLDEGESLRVKLNVKNEGNRFGKEVVQLYIKCKDGKIFRANKELKGFEKVSLNPKETKTVEFLLTPRDFCYFNVKINDWAIEDAIYEIMVGSSVSDIKLTKEIKLNAKEVEAPYDVEKVNDYYSFDGIIKNEAFKEVLGREIPDKEYLINPIRWDTYPLENTKTWFGRLFTKLLIKVAIKMTKSSTDNEMAEKFMISTITSCSLRTMSTTSGGLLSKTMMSGLICMFNGKYLRGTYRLLRGFRLNSKYNKILLKTEGYDYKNIMK